MSARLSRLSRLSRSSRTSLAALFGILQLGAALLAVGYGPRGLLLNTTWDEQQWVADGAKKGISLERAFYALRIRGVAAPKAHASTPARATVASEGDVLVQLVVSCPAMAKEGATLERRDAPTTDGAAESWPLTTKSPSRSLALPRAKAAWFQCAAPAKP